MRTPSASPRRWTCISGRRGSGLGNLRTGLENSKQTGAGSSVPPSKGRQNFHLPWFQGGDRAGVKLLGGSAAGTVPRAEAPHQYSQQWQPRPIGGAGLKAVKPPSGAARSAALTPGELGRSSGFRGSPGGSAGKELACIAGDLGSIPGLRRYPGEGNGYPLQYFGLENSMDRRAWRATVHGVAKWPLCGKQDEKGETLRALVSSDPD